MQHGRGERDPKRRHGRAGRGPETISEQELERNRANMWQDLPRPLDGQHYSERSADLSKVTVPLLSSATGVARDCTPVATSKGTRAASKQKWLEVHGGSHWAPFYTDWV